MEPSVSTLVLVAHPVDETLGFSSVCARADRQRGPTQGGRGNPAVRELAGLASA